MQNTNIPKFDIDALLKYATESSRSLSKLKNNQRTDIQYGIVVPDTEFKGTTANPPYVERDAVPGTGTVFKGTTANPPYVERDAVPDNIGRIPMGRTVPVVQGKIIHEPKQIQSDVIPTDTTTIGTNTTDATTIGRNTIGTNENSGRIRIFTGSDNNIVELDITDLSIDDKTGELKFE